MSKWERSSVENERDLKELLDERTRELEAFEERFRNVINKLADAIIVVDESGAMRFVNRAAENLFERDAGELIGAAFGFPVIIGETTEIDILRRSGKTIVVEMCAVETEWEGESGCLASLRDITDRKRAEQQRAELIREQAARAEAEAAGRCLKFLAEASSALASSLDYQTTLAGVARLAVPFLADYCIVDLIEDGALRQVAVAHVDRSKEEMLREMRRRCPFDMEQPFGVPKVLRTAQPEIVTGIGDQWLQAAARDAEHIEKMRALDFKSYLIVPLIAQGRALGAISLVSAQSARRYNEDDLRLAEDLARRAALAIDNARLYKEAQTIARLKDEFLTTLSHELRTPLTSMLGWARLLHNDNLDQETFSHAIDSIERNAQAQAQIIQDILDVSAIITGKLKLKIAPVFLPQVIEDAINSVRPAAEAKSIQVEVSCDGLIEPIEADRDRLQQAVWNLLSNAIKFTPKEGRVEVKARRNGSEAEITVSDTGYGIRRDFLPFVFERFRQADGSSTRAHGGLGLGLALVRHLAEMHGGTVQAASDGEGRGASFTIRLPLSLP